MSKEYNNEGLNYLVEYLIIIKMMFWTMIYKYLYKTKMDASEFLPILILSLQNC